MKQMALKDGAVFNSRSLLKETRENKTKTQFCAVLKRGALAQLT